MADNTATGTFTDNGDDQQLVCNGDVSFINSYTMQLRISITRIKNFKSE